MITVTAWSNKKKLQWSFSSDDLIELFSYLINNIYVKFRGQLCKQVIDIIPMGCDCAQQVADLYLFWYDQNYIEKGLEEGNSIVHELKFCKRYIDDLFAPNISDRAREAICNDTYPSLAVQILYRLIVVI